MKALEELINTDDPGIDQVKEWISGATVPVKLLPASNKSGKILHQLQVSTESPMGAIAYETGGVLVDNGWLRFLGSGHSELPRTLSDNLDYEQGFLLFADDAIGGFFALNGGALGDDIGMVYYLAPDDIDWEPLEIGYSAFFEWSLSENLAEFYLDLRWRTWKEDLAKLAPDKCFGFYPFLWTEQGDIETSHRNAVPVQEAWKLKTT